jgi:toxin ParE1/3/4
MEKKKLQVLTSNQFDNVDIPQIHAYGFETFGIIVADYFIDSIYTNLKLLEKNPLIFPECRHLKTKTQIYRNIILGSYLIIYRITSRRIEVLRAIHGSQSPKILKRVRQIRIK